MVVGVAVLVAVVPPLLWSQPWFDAIYALALLIIACPAALVISTPVSIVARPPRRGAASGQGGVYLEEGRNLQWLALDKTGTLTHGKPVQTDLQDWEPSDLSRQPAALVAASLAARSATPCRWPWPTRRARPAISCWTWPTSPPCPAVAWPA